MNAMVKFGNSNSAKQYETVYWYLNILVYSYSFIYHRKSIPIYKISFDPAEFPTYLFCSRCWFHPRQRFSLLKIATRVHQCEGQFEAEVAAHSVHKQLYFNVVRYVDGEYVAVVRIIQL